MRSFVRGDVADGGGAPCPSPCFDGGVVLQVELRPTLFFLLGL